MELLFFLLLIIIVLAVLPRLLRGRTLKDEELNEPKKSAHLVRYDNETRDIWGKTNSAGEAEQYVTQQLLDLGENYFIFQNVILPSAYSKTPYTEIDHIVVSCFGVFCIETKSHGGNIYGGKDAGKWKQWLHGKSYSFHNPLKQSYPHSEALKKFLGSNLRSNIHCYVVFPKARTVKVNSSLVTNDIHEVIARISNHRTRIYDNDDLLRILMSLANYDNMHAVVESSHIEGVRKYVNSKNH